MFVSLCFALSVIIVSWKGDIANIHWTNNRFLACSKAKAWCLPTNFRHIIFMQPTEPNEIYRFYTIFDQPNHQFNLALEIWFIIFLLYASYSTPLTCRLAKHATEIDVFQKRGTQFWLQHPDSMHVYSIHVYRFIASSQWNSNFHIFTFFRPSFNCKLQFVTWQLQINHRQRVQCNYAALLLIVRCASDIL